MPTYRYRLDLISDEDIVTQVPGPLVLGGTGPAIFKDIVAPAASKEDLDAYMTGFGYVFDSTDPAITPSHIASAIIGISEFVFRPSEPNPSGNVFASWAELVGAAALVKGQKTVYFDDTLAACVIPIGAWDFGAGTTTTFEGKTQLLDGTPIAIADGATLANVVEFNSVDITSNSTTFVIDAPATPIPAGPVYFFGGLTRFTQAGVGGAFIRVAVANIIGIALLLDAEIVSGSNLVDTTVAGAEVLILSLTTSTFGSNCMSGVAGSIYVGFLHSAAALLSPVQAGLPGGTFSVPIQLSELSAQVFYDDTVVTPPTLGAANVQDAIDALKPLTGTVWKYSGLYAGGVGLVASFMADVGPVGAVFVTALRMPVQRATTVATIRVRCNLNTLLTDLTVQTARDGIATGPSVTIGAGVTGIFTDTAALVISSADDGFDIVMSSTAGVNAASLSVSVELT